MDFDESIDRRDTHSEKWDAMEARYGVSNHDGISMWIADMDFDHPRPSKMPYPKCSTMVFMVTLAIKMNTWTQFSGG